jgi:hypothetical protein
MALHLYGFRGGQRDAHRTNRKVRRIYSLAEERSRCHCWMVAVPPDSIFPVDKLLVIQNCRRAGCNLRANVHFPSGPDIRRRTNANVCFRPIADIAGARHHASMRRSRATLLDHVFNAVGVLFSLWFIDVAQHKGWSTLSTIGLLVIVSIPIGLLLLWLKLRLRSRFWNVR